MLARSAASAKASLRRKAFWPTAMRLISSSLISANICKGSGGPTQNSTSVGPAISPTSPSRRNTIPSSGARSTSPSRRIILAAIGRGASEIALQLFVVELELVQHAALLGIVLTAENLAGLDDL